MIKVDAYRYAVVRLVTQQQRRSAGKLLFATVSLLSHDRPPPPSMVGVDRYSLKNQKETIFFRRTVLSAQAGLDWYRSLGLGVEKTPIPTKPEDVEKNDGVDLKVGTLIDDPAWPNLGWPIGAETDSFLNESGHPAPFMGTSSARIHRRFGEDTDFREFLANDGAVAFVARRLHVDLRQYIEYLGSAALIVPDPILQKIDHFYIHANEQQGERIFYHFVPRPGQTLAGLKITTFDKQSGFLTDFGTYDIPPDGILDVDKGSCIGMYGYAVTHPNFGVLSYMPATPFLRSITMNSHAVSGGGSTVSVAIGEAKDSERIEYQVGRGSSLSTTSIVGEKPSTSNVNVRIAIAASRRGKIANAQQYGQRWFENGSRKEAMYFIHGEIRRARSRIIIADPYLASLQLGQFLYAVNGVEVKVFLLTSSLAFKAKNPDISSKNEVGVGSAKASKSFRVDDFHNRLKQLEKDVNIKADARVGSSALLHDRFLVIDETVWFLGNSLNALGDKASMIVKLPNPDEMTEKLERMLEQAEYFDAYRKRILKESSGEPR